MNVEEARDRIAELMGWTRDGTDKFSLPQLKEFVKGKDPKLDEWLAATMESKSHFFGEPLKRR
ncbi:MAG: hypothetical protein ACWGQW_05330 [bacterium]